jgi:hypothetical protein
MLSACALFMIAFVMYNKDLLAGKSNTPIAAWALFSFITLINGCTYLKMGGSWVTAVLVFTGCFICVSTAVILVLRKNRDLSFSRLDVCVVLCGTVAIIIWQLSSATYGNWFNQIAYALSFTPIFRNAWKNPGNEPTRPWAIWTAAWVLNIAAVAIDPTATPSKFVVPVICLLYHLATTLLTLRKTQPLTVQA